MSIEVALQENTNTLRELITAIKVSFSTSTVHVAAEASRAAKEVIQKSTAAGTTQAATLESKGEHSTLAQTATETLAILPANKQRMPSYEETANEIVELSKIKGNGTAKAVLKQFGANKLTEIKPENYAAVIEAVMAVKG